MKLTTISGAAIAVLHSVCVAAAPPFYAQPVEGYQAQSQPIPGHTRLRISLTAETDVVESGVHVGQVTACSSTACYKLPTQAFVNLTNTAKGKATLIADAWVPPETIQSIQFDPVAGPTIVEGGISLPTPLALDASFPGGEVLLVLSQANRQGSRKFVPTAAAASLYGPAPEELYFNPKYSLDANLPMNTELHVPAAATSDPKIFEISVYDTGDKFPVVDIYPKLDLGRPATLSSRAIPPKPQSDGAVVRVGPPAGAAPELFAAPPGNETKMEIKQTGFINLSRPRLNTGSRDQLGELMTCLEMLHDPANQKRSLRRVEVIARDALDLVA